MSDNNELNTTGNPTIDKLISNIHAPEKAMSRCEALRAVTEQINSAAPIPPVRASDLKQLWDATRRMNADMPPRPGVAVGLAVYAAYGFEAAAASPEELLPITMRYQLISALVERGVLNDHLHGEELDEQAFRAAATMPYTKDDLAQATMQTMLMQLPAETVVQVREEMHAQGYDIDKPSVDGKFLDWLRNNR